MHKVFTIRHARPSLRSVPFHSPGCYESFIEDRRHGLIYGGMRLENIGTLEHTYAAEVLGFCAYCGTDDAWRKEHVALLSAGLSPLQTGCRRSTRILCQKFPQYRNEK